MKPVTLGDIIDAGRSLWCYCLDCCRERDVDPAAVPLPRDYPVPMVGRRMVCTSCGGRRVQTKPQIHTLPIREMRARRSEDREGRR